MLVAVGFSQTLQGTTTVKELSVPTGNYVQKVIPYPNGYYVICDAYEDLLIQRYNVAGLLVASNHYDNPHGGSDRFADAAMDTAGNLYIAVNSDSNLGPATWYVKFNASIAVQWERLIDGLNTAKVVVTPGGLGVCVGNTETPAQFQAVAHAANGNLIYTKTLSGDAYDAVIGLDNSLWIVGRTSTSVPRVWRYNGVTGNLITTWTDSFGTNGTSFRTAAIDPNGTFYAAGYSTDDGTTSTLKVSLLRFTNVFTRFKPITKGFYPRALRIDATNLYLLADQGLSGQKDTAFVIPKSNPTLAVPTLVATTNFRGMEIEGASDRVYIRSGNSVLLTSKSLVQAFDVNLTGMASLNGIARGTSAGHVFAFGQSANNVAGKVVRVNQNSSLGFSNDIGESTRGTVYPAASTVDASGELFVLHSTDGGLTNFGLKRINRLGTVVWSVPVGFVAYEAVSDAAHVYLAGETAFVNGDRKPTIAKFLKSNGTMVWSRFLEVDIQTLGDLRTICRLNDGNLAVGGQMGGKFVVAKVSSATGDAIWTRQTNDTTRCISLVTDAAGWIFAAGEFTHLMRLTSVGGVNWTQTLNGKNSKIAFDEDSTHLWIGSREGSNSTRFNRVERTTGIIQISPTQSANDDRMVVAMRGDGGATIGVSHYVDGSWVSLRVGQTVYGFESARRVADAKFFGNEIVILYDEEFPDGNGGFTRKMSVDRYSSTLVYQETRVIQPPGVGLDSHGAALLPGLQGQFFTLGSMERRNEGVAMLATRWRFEYAPTGLPNGYNVLRNNTLIVNSPGILGNDTDLNGDSMTAVLVTPPAAGDLGLNANGSFTYQAPATAGTRFFTYRAVDSTGRQSAPITVSLQVN